MKLLEFGVDSWPYPLSDEATFFARNLPPPSEELETGDISGARTSHSHGTFPVDSIWLSMTREAAFRLALALVSVMLHPEIPSVRVRLNNPDSQIRYLLLKVDWEQRPGIQQTPSAFHYEPLRMRKHPWYPLPPDLSRYDLPHVLMTNLEDCVVTREDWAACTVLSGFGSLQGCSLFALLLMSLADSKNSVLEVDLEHDPGFMGVAPSSCELRLALPGSLIY